MSTIESFVPEQHRAEFRSALDKVKEDAFFKGHADGATAAIGWLTASIYAGSGIGTLDYVRPEIMKQLKPALDKLLAEARREEAKIWHKKDLISGSAWGEERISNLRAAPRDSDKAASQPTGTPEERER